MTQEHDLEWSPSDGEGRECVTASDLDRLRIRLLRLLLQQKSHFTIKLCFRLTVSRLFHVDHVVQNRRGALSLAWHEWFPRKSKEWKIFLLRVGVVVRASNRKFRSSTQWHRQRHKFFIFNEQKKNIISLHRQIWTQQINLAPNVWPHTSIGRNGIAEVTGSNPVKALIFYRLLPSNCLNWKLYCDDHSSLSSTTAVQYEFHIYSTKTKPLHVLHVLLLFLYISFPFSANLRPEITITQVIKRTGTHKREFEFSLLVLTPHL